MGLPTQALHHLAGFNMKRELVGACLGKVVHPLLRVADHEVHIQKGGGVRAQGGHNGRADGQVGPVSSRLRMNNRRSKQAREIDGGRVEMKSSSKWARIRRSLDGHSVDRK